MSNIIDLTTGNFGYGFSDDYKQGYSDGRASMVAKLEKIRAEIENHCALAKENHCKYCSYCSNVMGVREILEIIDKYKAEREELKGESK